MRDLGRITTHVRAREAQTCCQSERPLGKLGQCQRFCGSATTCTPSDIDEEGAQHLCHARETCMEIGNALLRFGWEGLEGEVVGTWRQSRDLVDDSIHGLKSPVLVSVSLKECSGKPLISLLNEWLSDVWP